MQKNLSNKELVAAGHQFAKNLSSDTPLIDMAKMVSQLATQLDVVLVAAGEACKQRDAVLAENVALSRYFSASVVAVEHWNSWADAEDKLSSAPETPATDALLNAVRADAIDSAAAKVGEHAQLFKVGTEGWHKWGSVVMFLVDEARSLRAETDTTSSQYESLAGGK